MKDPVSKKRGEREYLNYDTQGCPLGSTSMYVQAPSYTHPHTERKKETDGELLYHSAGNVR